MSGAGESPQTVYVYTWPYQWLYEPVYWALGALAKSGRWKFQFETGFASDEDVLNAFTNQNGAKPLKIALCEPPAQPGYPLIPVLWRLPVWGLVPNRSLSVLGLQPSHWRPGMYPDTEVLLAVLKHAHVRIKWFPPDKSTAGRFSKEFLNAVAERVGKADSSIKALIADKIASAVVFSGNASDISHSDAQIAFAFSYTPFHVIDGGVVPLCEIPGIGNRVTAVIFPPDTAGNEPLQNLREQLLQRIKLSLSTLYEAVELEQDIQRLVDQGMKLRCSPEMPLEWQGNAKIASLLSVFVRRGCFFPYCVLDVSLQPDLFQMFKKTLDAHAGRMQESFKSLFRDFVSPGIPWPGLDCTRRFEILTASIDGEEGKQLADALLHPKGDKTVAFKKLLINHPEMPFVPLHQIRFPDLDFSTTGARLVCDAPGECGFLTNTPVMPCFTCAILGGHAALLLQVESYLTQELSRRFPAATIKSWNDKGDAEQSFRWSVLAFEDLKWMCDIFLDTLVRDNQHVGANLWCVPPHVKPVQGAKQVLFSIQTSAEKTPGKGSGPTRSGGDGKRRLRAWLKDQRDRVISTWLHYPCGYNGDPQNKWYSITDAAPQVGDPPWASQLAAVGHFYDWCKFAYVAVLGIPDDADTK